MNYNWVVLEELGITEQLLSDVFTNEECNQLICRESFPDIPDVPTYGILIVCEHAADLNLKLIRFSQSSC